MNRLSYLVVCASLAASATSARAQTVVAPAPPQAAAPVEPPPPLPPPPPLEEVRLEEIPAALALVAPATVPEAPPAPVRSEHITSGYDNGFFLQTPDQVSRLRIRGLVQPRFALVAADADVSTWTASFAVQRAQIELTGHVFSRALGFTMKTEFGKGEAFIKDAFMDAKVAEGMLLRTGLWKRPFSRQQLTSDWRLAFFERSTVDAAFGSGRDIGMALQADIDRSPAFEWNLGVFSGASDKSKITGDIPIDAENGIGSLDNVKVGNVPTLFTPTLVARFGYNVGAVQGYSEIDVAGGGPRCSIAASVLEAVDVSGKGKSATRAEVDAMLKIDHVTATGALFLSTLQDDPLAYIQTADKIGGYAQVGVLLCDVVHPALRYSLVNELADGALAHEVLANATMLLFGQNVLWGVEAGSIITDEGFDVRVRTQAQVQF